MYTKIRQERKSVRESVFTIKWHTNINFLIHTFFNNGVIGAYKKEKLFLFSTQCRLEPAIKVWNVSVREKKVCALVTTKKCPTTILVPLS